MGKKRRPSPTEKDIERIAEAIDKIDTFGKIEDQETFNNAYEEYFEDDKLKDNKELRNKVFRKLVREAERPISTGIRERATRKQRKIKGRVINAGELSYIGKVKGRIVYSRKESVNIKGKSVTKYRDKKGRFVSVKKNEKS